MSLTAVGFDLDYTLAVPDRERARLLAEAVEAVDAPTISREAYVEAHRRNLTRETRAPIFEELVGEEADAGRPRALARAYREAINEALVPVAGVEAMLAELRGRYRVGLLTNGPVVAQRGKLAALGWEDAFDAVLISGELAAGKPHAHAFEALLAALEADAERTVYVGDEVEADVGGGTAAGLSVIQVVDANGPAPDPRAAAHVEREELARALPDLLEDL